jgi:branched-chain amino acid transport system ATP-binding protein
MLLVYAIAPETVQLLQRFGWPGKLIVLVEQHARLALEFAERAVVLDRGRVVYDGVRQELLDDPDRLAGLIGVG